MGVGGLPTSATGGGWQPQTNTPNTTAREVTSMRFRRFIKESGPMAWGGSNKSEFDKNPPL